MKVICLIFINAFFLIPVIGQSAQSVSQLQEIIDKGVTEESLRSILAAGKSGDRNFVPLLRRLAERSNSKTELTSVASYSEIALASLGEKGYLASIIADVDSPNIFVQNVAIQKLAKVGGKAAFKTFVRLLDDNRYRKEIPADEEIRKAKEIGAGVRRGDEILEPRSFLVMKLLATMVADPPVAPQSIPNESHVRLWKDWFKTHKYLLE